MNIRGILKLHVEPDEPPAVASALCPLCQEDFETSADAAERLSCPGCGLTFAPSVPQPDAEVEAEAGMESNAEPEEPDDPFDRWLQGAPIQARQISDGEWLRNCARRHWLASGVAAAVVAGLVAAALISTSAWFQASSEARQALLARDRAEKLRQEAETARADDLRELAHLTALWKSEQSARRQAERRLDASLLAAEKADHGRRQAEEARRQAEREVRRAIAQQLAARSQLIRGDHPQRGLLLAAEALHLAQRDGEAPIASAAQYLRDRVGPDDGRRLEGHSAKITALAISRKSRWLATASVDNTTRLWNLQAADPASRPIVLAGHRGRVSAVVFSPDDRWLATSGYDSTVRLWNLADEDPAAESLVLRGHEGRLTDLALSSNARWLFTASNGYDQGDSKLRVWDLAAAAPTKASRALQGYGDRVQAIAISRDDRWLAALGDDGLPRLCRLTDQGPAAQPVVLDKHSGRVNQLIFSSDSRRLIAGGSNAQSGETWLWDLRGGEPDKSEPVRIAGHSGAIRSLASSSDGRYLATAGDDGLACVWDLAAKDCAASAIALRGHSGAVLAVLFSPDDRWLATAGADQNVCLWTMNKLSAGATPIVLRTHQGPVDSLAVSRDGKWLATAGDDHTVRVWNLRWDDLIDLALQSLPDKSPAPDALLPGSSSAESRISMAKRPFRFANPKGREDLRR